MRAIRVIVWASVMPLLILATNALGDGPALNLHVNQDGRFEALMPSSVRDSVIEGKELLDTQFESAASADNATFRVRTQVISPIKLDDEFVKELATSILAQAREKHRAASGNKLKTDREFKQYGIAASEFAYSSPAGNGISVRHRVLFDGERLYMASVTGPVRAIETTSANKFLDSVGPLGANPKNNAPPTAPATKPTPPAKPAAPSLSTTPETPAPPKMANPKTAKAGVPRGLQRYVNEAMGVETFMPKNVKEVHDSAQKTAIGLMGDKGFMASMAYLSKEESARLERLTPQQRLEELRPEVNKLIPNVVPDPITRRGVTGFEAVGTMKGVPHRARVRVYASNTRVYVTAAWGSNDFALSNDATDFLDAFRIAELESAADRSKNSFIEKAGAQGSEAKSLYRKRQSDRKARREKTIGGKGK